MSKISEKVAYLDGLMEGLDLEDVKLKKLFTAVIDALDEIAEEISDHEDAIAEIDESLDEVYDAMDDYDDILFGEACSAPFWPGGAKICTIRSPATLSKPSRQTSPWAAATAASPPTRTA